MDIKDQLKDIPIDQVAEGLGLGLQKHGDIPQDYPGMTQRGIEMVSRRICLVMMAVCFVLMPQSVPAQQKIAVEIRHDGDDSVGQRLAYQVKEGIRRSAGLRLTNIKEHRLIMRITTLDEFTDKPGTATVFGYALNEMGAEGLEMFLSSSAGFCGRDRVNSIAETLVARIDREADDLRGSWSK